MKRYTCMMLAITMILLSTSALASGAPTSQFGYEGWPYLQESICFLGCNNCSNETTCHNCLFCQDVMITARPQQLFTPAPIQTARPTLKPIVPTNKPAIKPSNQPITRPTTTPSTSTGDYTTILISAQEQKALNLLNVDRTANGLAPLSLDPELSRIARIKSQDMKDNHYFAHTSPTYGNAASMLTQFGYKYKGVGENIAGRRTVH